MNKPTSFDEYVSDFTFEISERLNQIRTLIHTIAPEATESVAYGMPAYKLFGKPMAYFAGLKKHIGFYALPSGHEKFKEKLSEYKQGKGSVQFPHNKPLPYALFEEIIRFRIYELTLFNSQKK